MLKPILDRIHLDSLGSIEYYQQLAKDLGLKEVRIVDLSSNLPAHYSRVLQELVAQHHTLIRVCSEEYLANMKMGLQHWIDAGMAGHLTWGILKFQKKTSRRMKLFPSVLFTSYRDAAFFPCTAGFFACIGGAG